MHARFASLLAGLVALGLASPALAAPMPEPVPEESPAPVVAEPEEAASAALDEEPTDAELDPIDETIPPDRTRRGPNFADLFGIGWLGQAAGALVGAGIGLSIAGGVGCDASGQGWMSGYTCTAGYFYLATIGALIAMPIGTIVSLGIAVETSGAHYDWVGETVLGTLLGWLPAILALPIHLWTGQLSGPLVYAMAAGAGLSPLLGAGFTRSQLIHHGFALAPYATPMADGAVVGFRGRF